MKNMTKLKKSLEKIKEDNPVPSIDKDLITALWEMYETSTCKKQSVIDIVYNHIKTLQNGVETDNEYPIKISEEDDFLG